MSSSVLNKELQTIIEQTIGEADEPKYVFTDEDTHAINEINKILMPELKKYDNLNNYKYNVVKDKEGSAVFHYTIGEISLMFRFYPGKAYIVSYDSFYHTFSETFDDSKKLLYLVKVQARFIAKSMSNIIDFTELKKHFNKL